jgi:hypothetical protein
MRIAVSVLRIIDSTRSEYRRFKFVIFSARQNADFIAELDQQFGLAAAFFKTNLGGVDVGCSALLKVETQFLVEVLEIARDSPGKERE